MMVIAAKRLGIDRAQGVGLLIPIEIVDFSHMIIGHV